MIHANVGSIESLLHSDKHVAIALLASFLTASALSLAYVEFAPIRSKAIIDPIGIGYFEPPSKRAKGQDPGSVLRQSYGSELVICKKWLLGSAGCHTPKPYQDIIVYGHDFATPHGNFKAVTRITDANGNNLYQNHPDHVIADWRSRSILDFLLIGIGVTWVVAGLGLIARKVLSRMI